MIHEREKDREEGVLREVLSWEIRKDVEEHILDLEEIILGL